MNFQIRRNYFLRYKLITVFQTRSTYLSWLNTLDNYLPQTTITYRVVLFLHFLDINHISRISTFNDKNSIAN